MKNRIIFYFIIINGTSFINGFDWKVFTKLPERIVHSALYLKKILDYLSTHTFEKLADITGKTINCTLVKKEDIINHLNTAELKIVECALELTNTFRPYSKDLIKLVLDILNISEAASPCISATNNLPECFFTKVMPFYEEASF
ncbi:hypothetical protein L9F63_005925, partial [Diploptera punctata]